MRVNYRRIIGLFILLMLLGIFASATLAAKKVYVMTGKISHINLAYDTVVIEVPLGSQMFTVGGPLGPNASLTKKGKTASLEDFEIGERVKVKWHSTDKGHVIDALTVD